MLGLNTRVDRLLSHKLIVHKQFAQQLVLMLVPNVERYNNLHLDLQDESLLYLLNGE